MCMKGSLELPSDRLSARRARAYVVERCQDWGVPDICDELALPVSELVTNAVVHAQTPVLVSMSLAERFVEVAVRDDNPRPPVLRPVRRDPLGDIDRAVAITPDLPLDPRHPALVVGEAGGTTPSPRPPDRAALPVG